MYEAVHHPIRLLRRNVVNQFIFFSIVAASIVFSAMAWQLWRRVSAVQNHSDRMLAMRDSKNLAGYTEGKSVLKGLTARSIEDGRVVDLEIEFSGKTLLIVNVATEVPQAYRHFEELQAIYNTNVEADFEILAFPCNQFAYMESRSNEAIAHFIKTHNVTFSVFQKVDVNGPGSHPLFTRLRTALGLSSVDWNFCKFLVGDDGVPLQYYDNLFSYNQLRRKVAQTVLPPYAA